MRLLPRVPPHVHDEHVLRLERLLLPGAAAPLADEGLLVGADVVAVQVADEHVLAAEVAAVAAGPVAAGLHEVVVEVGLVLDRGGRGGVVFGSAAACKSSNRLRDVSIIGIC